VHLSEQQGAPQAQRLDGPSQLRVRRAAHGEGEPAAEPREAVHVRERGEAIVDGYDSGYKVADRHRVCRARLRLRLRLQQVTAPGACKWVGTRVRARVRGEVRVGARARARARARVCGQGQA